MNYNKKNKIYKNFPALLAKLQKALESLDDEALDQIINSETFQIFPSEVESSGEGISDISEKGKSASKKANLHDKSSQRNSSKKAELDDHQLAEIKAKLNNLNNKDEGKAFLEEECRTVKNLEKLAKYLDVFYLKKNKQELLNSIVDEIIGTRTRSIAIQGEALVSKEKSSLTDTTHDNGDSQEQENIQDELKNIQESDDDLSEKEAKKAEDSLIEQEDIEHSKIEAQENDASLDKEKKENA